MKCTICGTDKNVRKVIDLPLANGRAGHIKLSEWTYYCPECIKQQSELFTKQMDDLLRSRQ